MKKKSGFTLLELLICISLISVVMIFLFRLISDVQGENLSNTYIVENQTNRNEIITKISSILAKNGDISSVGVKRDLRTTSIYITFSNSKELQIDISKSNIHFTLDSESNNYEMKGENAYYDPNIEYREVSYNNIKYTIFDIKTEKKGLKSTIIDDIELMLNTSGVTIENIVPVIYSVTANPNGGTLYSTNGWTLSGSSATKPIEYDEAYGTLPTVKKTGYRLDGWTLLPEGYTQVDYIKSNGTQYINTGYVPKIVTKLELDLSFSGSFKDVNTYGGSAAFFGVRESDNTAIFQANFGDAANTSRKIFNWYDKVDIQNLETFTVTDSILLNRNTFTVDEGSVSYGAYGRNLTPKSTNNINPLFLFANNRVYNNTITPFTAYNMRVYDMRIYESGTLVRHYIPCINESIGEAGLYEVVNGEFHGNDGEDEFATGDNVYITSSSKVNTVSNQTIYAHWSQTQ